VALKRTHPKRWREVLMPLPGAKRLERMPFSTAPERMSRAVRRKKSAELSGHEDAIFAQ
jgi:hypothetical protein